MPVHILPPLKVSGSALAIPRASETQSGYLSKEDFILFSPEGAVAVNSFNTRTGEIILLGDDVLAALGYAPINKAGDTMTGPLGLPGPPTLALHAATKAYVDSPATWYTRDFKASGSKLTYTGTASAGTTTLTLPGASDFAVGQGVLVKGAGSSSSGIPGALLTKVDAVAGNVITLHDPVTSAVSVVADNVMHDDTVAINSAMQAVVTALGGTLVFDPGFYRVNGPVLSSGSVLRLPYHSGATGSPQIALRLVGQPNPWLSYGYPSSGKNPQYGVIIQSDVRNAAASILAATAWSPTFGWEGPAWINNLTFYMDGFTFRAYPDPEISGVDLGGCDHIHIRNTIIDIGYLNWADAGPQPTHPGVFGFRTPAVAVGIADNTVENMAILGYYIGVWFGEELCANLIQAFSCMVGFQSLPCQYGSRFYSSLAWHCPTEVYIAGGGGHAARMFVDMSIDIECQTDSARWDYTPPGRDFYDPDNGGSGFIRYCKNSGDGSATPTDAGITGFSKCDFLNLGTGLHRPATP